MQHSFSTRLRGSFSQVLEDVANSIICSKHLLSRVGTKTAHLQTWFVSSSKQTWESWMMRRWVNDAQNQAHEVGSADQALTLAFLANVAMCACGTPLVLRDFHHHL